MNRNAIIHSLKHLLYQIEKSEYQWMHTGARAHLVAPTGGFEDYTSIESRCGRRFILHADDEVPTVTEADKCRVCQQREHQGY